jgi:uncharacterized membrane protein YfcA
VQGIDLWALAIIVFCHFIGGVAAFGSALLSVPFLILLWGPSDLERAVFLVLVLGLTQSSMLFTRTWRDLELSRVWPIHLGAFLSLPFGFLLVGVLPRNTVVVTLAILILLVAGHIAVSVYRPASSGPAFLESTKVDRLLAPACGVLGGLIHGAFGIGGSVLVVGVHLAAPGKREFRAAMALLWTMLGCLFLCLAFFTGRTGNQRPADLLFGLAGVIAATWLGDRLAARLRKKFFSVLVAGLLFISALSLLHSV